MVLSPHAHAGSVRAGIMSWHPQRQDLRAVAAGPKVLVCFLDEIAESGTREVAYSWEHDTPPPGTRVLGLSGSIHSLSFSPSGDRLVSGTSEGRVRLSLLPVPLHSAKDVEEHLLCCCMRIFYSLMCSRQLASFGSHLQLIPGFPG